MELLTYPKATAPNVRRTYRRLRREGHPARHALARARQSHAEPAAGLSDAMPCGAEWGAFELTRGGVRYRISWELDTDTSPVDSLHCARARAREGSMRAGSARSTRLSRRCT